MSDKYDKSVSKNTNETGGSLYVVSTPIGNLGDITYRAVEVLKAVQLVAAEDTRRASILFRKYNISTPCLSYYEHNARKRVPELIRKLKDGSDVALISEAGTPGISDPGFLLIRECVREGVRIIPVPGASAALAALVISGLPTDSFVFEGFLPPKKGRRKKLEALIDEKRTIIFYESPHRIKRTLFDLSEVFGDREAVIAREITKIHEEALYTTLFNASEHFDKIKPKGEFVIVLKGAAKK